MGVMLQSGKSKGAHSVGEQLEQDGERCIYCVIDGCFLNLEVLSEEAVHVTNLSIM